MMADLKPAELLDRFEAPPGWNTWHHEVFRQAFLRSPGSMTHLGHRAMREALVMAVVDREPPDEADPIAVWAEHVIAHLAAYVELECETLRGRPMRIEVDSWSRDATCRRQTDRGPETPRGTASATVRSGGSEATVKVNHVVDPVPTEPEPFQISAKTVFVFWKSNGRKTQKAPRKLGLKHVTAPGTTWFNGRQDAAVALGCAVEDLRWSKSEEG